MRLDKGGIRLFGLFGIDVFMHWSWLVVAAIQITTRKNTYSSAAWKIPEYLAIFVIVLMHEFGHALACRSVGGKAERIILWPLGGVAFVTPPPRPGAVLWSIAAGPLVNLLLLPVTVALYVAVGSATGERGDLYQFVVAIMVINGMIAGFNLLPFYPLDGGQILRSLLWFAVGPIKSLRAATFIGLLGSGALLLWGVTQEQTWMAIMGGFGAMRAFQGFRAAGAPRREGLACPSCRAAPPVAPIWVCQCGARFDAFEGGGCPQCGTFASNLTCPSCSQGAPARAWSQRLYQGM
jgi:Zn-dependent protease